MSLSSPLSTDTRLRVSEIFFSIQGESSRAGLPTVFIRLTGCPLRCQYCDTTYAFTGGEWLSIGDIVEKTGAHPARWVTVTGGEPLAQSDCLELLRRLCDLGYGVSLETSGALDISAVDQRVMKVLDIKTPGSGEHRHNRFENLAFLDAKDEIKFVICNRDDYDWAKEILNAHRLTERVAVLFSPSSAQQDATSLGEWILADGLAVRLQLQLHKILWQDARGH